MKKLVLVLLLLSALPASAQSIGTFDTALKPLPTARGQKIASAASWVTLGANVGLRTWDAWHSEDRKRALIVEGVQLGIAGGVSAATKSIFHRARPCAPDDSCGPDDPHKSFLSGHSAFACSAVQTRGTGRRLAISLTLGLGTAEARVLANKHWPTDVLAGCGVGLLASLIQ